MNTKTRLIIILISVISFTGMRAQEGEHRHELSVGAGVWSTSNLAFTLGDAFVNAIDIAGTVQFEEQKASPVYHISYKYFPKQKFGVGATFATGSERATGKTDNQDNGKLKRAYINIAIEPTYYYLNRKHFKLYGLVGVGLLYLHQDYTPNNGEKKSQSLYTTDFQITPIGIKAGNAIGGYLEAGLGYRGIISCGLFCRF